MKALEVLLLDLCFLLTVGVKSPDVYKLMISFLQDAKSI